MLKVLPMMLPVVMILVLLLVGMQQKQLGIVVEQ
jgi:hypothetical protein